jgi:hypothetical protein
MELREIPKDFSYNLRYEAGNKLNPLIMDLSVLLSMPSLILIYGKWKTGKTDFSLLLGELALENQLVHHVATNIENDAFPVINDMVTLNYWMHDDIKRAGVKLYILDEANVHFTNRRAMSNKNVGLQTVLPEISKAKCRIILLGQNPKGMDKFIRNYIWLKGVYMKVSLRKAILNSSLLDPPLRTYGKIPPSHIAFDPFTTAPFQLKPDLSQVLADEDLQKLWLYATNKKKAGEIEKHPEAWRRLVKRSLQKLIENYAHSLTKHGGGIYAEEKEGFSPREPIIPPELMEKELR